MMHHSMSPLGKGEFPEKVCKKGIAPELLNKSSFPSAPDRDGIRNAVTAPWKDVNHNWVYCLHRHDVPVAVQIGDCTRYLIEKFDPPQVNVFLESHGQSREVRREQEQLYRECINSPSEDSLVMVLRSIHRAIEQGKSTKEERLPFLGSLLVALRAAGQLGRPINIRLIDESYENVAPLLDKSNHLQEMIKRLQSLPIKIATGFQEQIIERHEQFFQNGGEINQIRENAMKSELAELRDRVSPDDLTLVLIGGAHRPVIDVARPHSRVELNVSWQLREYLPGVEAVRGPELDDEAMLKARDKMLTKRDILTGLFYIKLGWTITRRLLEIQKIEGRQLPPIYDDRVTGVLANLILDGLSVDKLEALYEDCFVPKALWKGDGRKPTMLARAAAFFSQEWEHSMYDQSFEVMHRLLTRDYGFCDSSAAISYLKLVQDLIVPLNGQVSQEGGRQNGRT